MTTTEKISQLILALARNNQKMGVRAASKNKKLITNLSTELCTEMDSKHPWDLVTWCEENTSATQDQIEQQWNLLHGIKNPNQDTKKETDVKNNEDTKKIVGVRDEVLVFAETIDQLMTNHNCSMMEAVGMFNESYKQALKIKRNRAWLQSIEFKYTVKDETLLAMVWGKSRDEQASTLQIDRAYYSAQTNQMRLFLAYIMEACNKSGKYDASWGTGCLLITSK